MVAAGAAGEDRAVVAFNDTFTGLRQRGIDADPRHAWSANNPRILSAYHFGT